MSLFYPRFSLSLVIVGAVCGGRCVDGQGDLADLLHPDRPGRGDQNVVVLPVQHLLVHALQPHRFGDVCLVVVVPAVWVSGQGGRLGEGAEGGKRRSWRRGCVGPNCGGAPAAVRVTQNLTFTGAGPQSFMVTREESRVTLRTRQHLATICVFCATRCLFPHHFDHPWVQPQRHPSSCRRPH